VRWVNGMRELVQVVLPTQFGEFQATAFEVHSGLVYLALAKGELAGGDAALTRLHSECLTGDALGSLRCECGIALRLALRRIAAEGRGLLLYATAHEGRGMGMVERLRAYVDQDDRAHDGAHENGVHDGAHGVDEGLRLGLPADDRRYAAEAEVLHALGIGSVRLLTNDQEKARGLREAGITVAGTEPLRTAAHSHNTGYLHTTERRLDHQETDREPGSPDAVRLLGDVDPPADRPYVVLKYAQTLDGRIATANGDSKWISGEEERGVSHALRAACDAVMVGVGTVLRDDPRLTVRLVPGASPLRVVLDSTLRTPSNALLLDGDPLTVVLTTDRASEGDRERVRETGAGVRVLPPGPGGVDLVAGLRMLRECGVLSLLVEGGAKVITSLLSAGLVDRVVVGTAPKIIGAGTEAVGDLGVVRVAEGIALRNRSVHLTADDILTAWDVC
jgi:3,4-dihydroxy 2-butanone 4-phosphate synthase/GTP cyclohydrolase II